jgi:hypothetical protein
MENVKSRINGWIIFLFSKKICLTPFHMLSSVLANNLKLIANSPFKVISYSLLVIS